MTEKVKASGSCLCGKVSISSEEVSTDLGVCHCDMCRSWSSGPFLGLDCGTKPSIEGSEYVKYYNSSEWAERGFCSECGTSLFYRLKSTNQHIVSSEIFKGIQPVMDHQIFIDSKPSYYDFSNKTKNMTGAEVFAAFGGDS